MRTGQDGCPATVPGVREEALVLGPLPRLYSLLILASLLGIGIGLGAWIGFHDEAPVVITTGIAIGVALAALTSWVLLHDFRHRSGARSSEARRRP
jgi:xanthine/uracil permease